MPEGPEMYRVARRVTKAVGHRPLNEVWFAFDHLRPWSKRLAGQKFERAGWPYRDYRHFVFGRDGQVCHACDTPIERITVSGRRLYHCPTCQP